MGTRRCAVIVLQAIAFAVLTTRVVSFLHAVDNENVSQYNQTIDLSWILKTYNGKCYGFVTTMMYKREGCDPVYKTNMICAGTCLSSVYPQGEEFKEFGQACQARRLIWEQMRFICTKDTIKFAWIQIVDGCQCNEVSGGLGPSDIN